MRFLKVLLAATLVALLAACATSEPVKDWENRSVAYGWVDIRDIEINSIAAIYIQQYRPKTDTPYYGAGVRKLKDGYVFWSMALPPGAHKLSTIKGQTCIGILCGNTFYTYDFGKQGEDVGAVVIKAPGVYPLGAYKMQKENTGFFEAGRFKVRPAADAPTRREMLEAILKDTEDVPVQAARIRTELARLP